MYFQRNFYEDNFDPHASSTKFLHRVGVFRNTYVLMMFVRFYGNIYEYECKTVNNKLVAKYDLSPFPYFITAIFFHLNHFKNQNSHRMPN